MLKVRPLLSLLESPHNKKIRLSHNNNNLPSDDEGDLPLHWAVREGNVDMVRLLVKLGTNYHSPNADGEDPLQLASCLDDEAVQEALAEAIEEYQEERDATFEDAARSPMELDGHSLLDVQFAKLFRETTAERDAKIPPAFRPRGVC